MKDSLPTIRVEGNGRFAVAGLTLEEAIAFRATAIITRDTLKHRPTKKAAKRA
jgi:hypothetical protein